MISGYLAFLIFICVCDKEEPSGAPTCLLSEMNFRTIWTSYIFTCEVHVCRLILSFHYAVWVNTAVTFRAAHTMVFAYNSQNWTLVETWGSLMSSTTGTGVKINLKVNIFKPEGKDSRSRRRLKSNRRYTFVCFTDLILIFQRPSGPTSSLLWTGSDPKGQICGLLDHKLPPKSTSRSRTF